MKRTSTKILFIVLTILLFVSTAFAQTMPDTLKVFTPDQLKQDFSMLKDSLQQRHAGLYRYKTKKQIDRLFDETYAKLDNPMTSVEYFKIISYLVGSIEDGHTECFLSKEDIKWIVSHVKIFPMQLRLIKDQAFTPCATKEFDPGTEIMYINNEPIEQIRKRLFLELSSDGSIQTGKYVKINDGHDPFSYLYLIVYGEQTTFKVEYKTASGHKATKVLQAVYFHDMECPPTQIKIDKYLNLEYKSDSVAVMTIGTFANELLEHTNENLSDFFESSFRQLKEKHINNLIIDLRQNGGGDDINGALLYRYLTNTPFHYYASLNSVTKPIEHPNLHLQQPMDNNYKGKVYFLIGGKSFSGAAEFASVAQSNGRGVFIGEETGGGYYGNTSGHKIGMILPNTGIRVNIPLNKYVMAVRKVKYPDRGIIPDYIVVPTITDYINHNDVQMGKAIQLILKNGQ